MRARRRNLLLALISSIAVVLTLLATPTGAQAVTCPGSTTWDNILQQCVK